MVAHSSVLPACWRLRQEDHHKFEACLNYKKRTLPKIKYFISLPLVNGFLSWRFWGNGLKLDSSSIARPCRGSEN